MSHKTLQVIDYALGETKETFKNICQYHECIFISYLFLIFFYLLLYLYSCLCHYAYAIYPYLNPIHLLPFLYLWSNLIHSLPFHSLFIAFPKVWSDVHLSIVPSHFSSFSCFHSILLSSLSHYHPTLPDPKGCTGLSPYSYYLCSAQPWPSSISRRPVCTISLSFDLI